MRTLPRKKSIKPLLGLLFLLATPAAYGQADSLTLSSGIAAANGTVSLNLVLTSPAGNEPAALQWTFTYPTSNVLSISAAAGPSATNAGKALNCTAGSGAYTCLAWGMNNSTIQNGTVAIVNLTIAAGVIGTSINIGNSLAASSSGQSLATSATGGTVTGPGAPAPTLTSLSCNPTSLGTSGSTSCTVTLNGPSSPGGTTVSLSSNNVLLPVPAPTITVAAGSATTTFNATAGNIASGQNATLTATLSGASQTATISLVSALTVSSLTCNPTSLTSGTSATCTVNLSGVAPAGGVVVSLASSNALLPGRAATITVPAGSATTTFTATADTIAGAQNAKIIATLNGVSQSTTISLGPLALSSLACGPTNLASGAAATCTVTLNNTAPAGGTVISLSSNNALLPIPASTITVPAGLTTTIFNATAGSIASGQSATLTATLNGVSQTVIITLVAPAVLSSLTCNPTSLTSATSATCTVTLSQAAPTGGTVVSLSSSNALLPVPASTITVPAGLATTTFSATAGSIASDQSAMLTATLSGVSKTATIGLVSPVTVSSLTCNPASLTSGTSTTCTVTLSKTAPAGGSAVALSSNNALLPVPASTITVPAGLATTTFSATAGNIATGQNATLTATLNSVSQTATINLVSTVTISSLACNPTSLTSATSATCTVTLSKMAPTGGTVVSLSSNNALLPVPASTIAVPAGLATTTFSATSGSIASGQSATLTATLSGASQTATISLVSALTVSSLTCTPTILTSGTSATCTVNLSSAAPAGGSAVSLASSNALLPGRAATITVPAGSATTTFAATAGTIVSDQNAKIIATLNGVSQTTTITLEAPGLLVAYSFDEGSGPTAGDSSGNGINVSTASATWTLGKYSNALLFNGNSSYLDLGNPPLLQTSGSMTWSAWVNSAGYSPADGDIVASSTSTVGWQLKTSLDTGAHTFAVAVTPAGGASHTQRYSNTVWALNTWYHVAGVYNASAQTLDIYVNGVLDDGLLSGKVPSSQAISGVDTTIGNGAGGSYFNGVIDNLRIYSRALAPAEIQNDIVTPVSGLTSLVRMGSMVGSALQARPVLPSRKAIDPSVVSSSRAQGAVSALSCSPRAAAPGAQLTCALEVKTSPTPLKLQLASSSGQVKIPAVVATRSNQSGLTFRASVDPVARQQSVVITATLGNSQVQDVVMVLPGAGPVLTIPGTRFARLGTPVDFAVSAVDPADLPIQLAARGLPAGASFDPESGRFRWIPDESQEGKYVIAFTASNLARQLTSEELTIEVGAGAPALTSSQTLACSPNAIATLTGTWLAPPESVLWKPSGGAMDLGGVRVRINGQSVPVLYSSATRVDFLCPNLDAGTQLSVVVETPGGITKPLTATMNEASPTILSMGGSGQNQGPLSFVETQDLVIARDFRMSGHPAQAGDEVLILATGLGAAGGTSSVALFVKIGEAYAAIESVQPVPGHEGLYSIKVRIPVVGFGDAVPVQLEALTSNGQLSSNVVTAAIEAVTQ